MNVNVCIPGTLGTTQYIMYVVYFDACCVCRPLSYICPARNPIQRTGVLRPNHVVFSEGYMKEEKKREKRMSSKVM